MAVVTSFEADRVVGAVPLKVQFTDTSTGSPDTWWWDFGDGERGSNAQNPTHTYFCEGTYSVTLTAWEADGGVGQIRATILSTTKKTGSGGVEFNAWNSFLAASFISTIDAEYQYSYEKPTSGHSAVYNQRETLYNLDLTSYSHGDNVIILMYRNRIFNYARRCPAPRPPEQHWVSNDQLDDIPIYKFSDDSGSPIYTPIQMISAPDLLEANDHAGEDWQLKLKNGKTCTGTTWASEDCTENPDVFNYPYIHQRKWVDCIQEDIRWQRIGLGCVPEDPIFGSAVDVDVLSVWAYVHSWVTIDSITNVNFITTNSPIITRPPVLISGIREAYFKDGWENDKHFYLEQPNCLPCSIQYFDLFINTTNE